jgi:hypothetical protein
VSQPNRQWVPGSWQIQDGYYVWVDGYWQDVSTWQPRVHQQQQLGQIWVEGRYEWQNGVNVWVPAHWQQTGGYYQ